MAKSTKRKKRGLLIMLELLLILLAAAGIIFGLYTYLQKGSANKPSVDYLDKQEDEHSNPEFIGNQTAPEILDSLPRNHYLFDGFIQEDGRIRYEDDTYISKAGIDVSYYQGNINWEKVAATDIAYAIIQLGYRSYEDGSVFEDRNFRTYLDGARAAGLEVGVYFFSQALSEEEAVEEAEFVLDTLAGTELDYPVFFDWEPISFAEARTDGVTGDVITACAKAFCETIEQGGYEAGVYFNQVDIYEVIDYSAVEEYEIWLAQYHDRPEMIYDFTYWQYTDSGKVDGIDIIVDLNIHFVKKETAQ